MAEALNMAQDAVWCDLCPSNQFLKSPAELHCQPCNVNLCRACVGDHLMSKSSLRHDVVEYKLREAEPKYPECQTHPGKKCELFCQQCHVPVCVICLTSTHKKHDVVEGFFFMDCQIANIMQDTEELERVVAPKYEDRDSQIENDMSKRSKKYDSLITDLTDHGQDWHKEVDKIINTHTADVQKDKREDLSHLQKYQSDIRNKKSLVYQTIEENKKILKSNDITELAKYRSKNNELKQMPPKAYYTLPSFHPIVTKGKELLQHLGTLSASIKLEDYTTKVADHMSSILSLKQNFVQVEAIITRFIDYKALLRISCFGDDRAWISGEKNKIKHINLSCDEIEEVDIPGCRRPAGLHVTKDGDVLFGDFEHRSIKTIQNRKISTVIELHDWYPRAVCSSFKGDILVLMENRADDVRLVRYSGLQTKWVMQQNENGKQFFFHSKDSRYIAENKNADVCVENITEIVVLDYSGGFRYRYNGQYPSKESNKRFRARGIGTDSKCQIVIADSENHCIHVIDKDGQFMCYIHIRDLDNPWPVSVDNQDRLWVGEISGHIKVIRYLD